MLIFFFKEINKLGTSRTYEHVLTKSAPTNKTITYPLLTKLLFVNEFLLKVIHKKFIG